MKFPKEYNKEETIKLKKWQISVILTAMKYGVGCFRNLTMGLIYERAKEGIQLDIKKEAEAMIWEIRDQANIDKDGAIINWLKKKRFPSSPKY